MNERVLVTGGAGYIGSILTKALLRKHFDVTVLDNFMYGQDGLLDCCASEKFHVVRGDVRDERTLSEAMAGKSFIIHLAAIVGAPACERDKQAARTVNLDATRTMLSLRKKGQKILYPCTNSGYGVGQKDAFCTEETPLRPISEYGKLKVEAERTVMESGESVSLRLATVFGASPRMRTDLLVNDFVYRAVTDGYLMVFEGHFRRNYIHVRDVARAFLFCMENFHSMKNEAYNVGLSNANISKLELCAAVKKHIPGFMYVESQIRKDPDKRNYIVSNEKVEKAGFSPRYSLDFGIEELIKAYAVTGNTAKKAYVNS